MENMNELINASARQLAIRHPLATINGTQVYQLQQGWELETLLADQNAVKITNQEDFERALNAPYMATLVVPNDASLTQEIAMQLLKNSFAAKTVFWQSKI